MDFWCAAARPAGARSCAGGAPAAGAASRCRRGGKTEKRFGLDGTRRLGRKAEFERLLRQGARRSMAGYTFYMERRDAGRPRLGMLVTRRHAAAATERNRIKRCIREAFRLEQEKLGALDLLVRPPYGARPDASMIARLRKLLCSLNP